MKKLIILLFTLIIMVLIYSLYTYRGNSESLEQKKAEEYFENYENKVLNREQEIKELNKKQRQSSYVAIKNQTYEDLTFEIIDLWENKTYQVLALKKKSGKSVRFYFGEYVIKIALGERYNNAILTSEKFLVLAEIEHGIVCEIILKRVVTNKGSRSPESFGFEYVNFVRNDY